MLVPTRADTLIIYVLPITVLNRDWKVWIYSAIGQTGPETRAVILDEVITGVEGEPPEIEIRAVGAANQGAIYIQYAERVI